MLDLQTVAATLDSRRAPSPAPSRDEPCLRRLREYAEILGFPLGCVSLRSGELLAVSQPRFALPWSFELRSRLPEATAAQTLEFPSGLHMAALPLPAWGGEPVTAVGLGVARPGLCPPELQRIAAAEEWSPADLADCLADLPHSSATLFARLVKSACLQVNLRGREAEHSQEVNSLARQLEGTYDEICLLHALTQNLQLSRGARDLAELLLERLPGLIPAEGYAVWLTHDADPDAGFLKSGHVPFDVAGLSRFIAAHDDCDFTRPLVRNRLRGTLLGAEFPELRNIAVVAIAEGPHRSGWLCCCNLDDGRDFGTVETRLLSSVGTILGTHGRNLELYRRHDELLLSFVRSLVSSLDAKDPYTRGHSERVGLIARRIGAQLNLPEDDLDDIYLSGLLHDIGKIGVDDAILRKPGALTPEEFDQVKKHPVIGANILLGLRNLQHVIPGVRFHHEAWNGRGYPDGLAGEQIPLMARILALADSYDAMGSDRPYRSGMPLPTLESILRDGAGHQWDPALVTAYFECREDVWRVGREAAPSVESLIRLRDLG